jgi:hypothetical protein
MAGRSQQWEYKAVQLGKNEERDLTTLLNLHAKEGWKFSGQITTDERYIVFERSTRGEAAFGGGASRRTPTTSATAVSGKVTAPRRGATVDPNDKPAPKRVPPGDPNLNRPPE